MAHLSRQEFSDVSLADGGGGGGGGVGGVATPPFLLLLPNSCFFFNIQICPSSQSTLCFCYFVLCEANYIFLITCTRLFRAGH